MTLCADALNLAKANPNQREKYFKAVMLEFILVVQLFIWGFNVLRHGFPPPFNPAVERTTCSLRTGAGITKS